eukprot:4645467-Pleurochrysis_carterae.AAC.2
MATRLEMADARVVVELEDVPVVRGHGVWQRHLEVVAVDELGVDGGVVQRRKVRRVRVMCRLRVARLRPRLLIVTRPDTRTRVASKARLLVGEVLLCGGVRGVGGVSGTESKRQLLRG